MISNNKNTVYTVSSLTRELKNMVEGKYRFICVQGEISNLSRPFSGHSYFTLKDSSAQLKAVLFKGQARYLEKAIADGQKVICHGRISIYEPRGDYQIIVDTIDFHGSGALQLKFEKLKKELQAEGLFDEARKQPISSYPKEIVLITSPTGAAVHDFLTIWKKQNFPVNISIVPVRVQGNSASTEIAEAVVSTNKNIPQTSIIVLCRGGGSLEDLWAFNEEVLARAIAQSHIPIVSAVGHEVDFSISDFCADLRAPTPTAAAEMIIPDGNLLRTQISQFQHRLTRSICNRVESLEHRVSQSRRLLGDMNFLFTNNSLQLDHATLRLVTVMEKRINNDIAQCSKLSDKLQNQSPVTKIQLQNQRLHFATEKLNYLINASIFNKEVALRGQVAKLDSVSPLATLARGYSITTKINQTNGSKTVVRDSAKLQQGDLLQVRLHKGVVECGVIKTTAS